MKKLTLINFFIISTFFIGIFTHLYIKQINRLFDKSENGLKIQNLSGNNISLVKTGEKVQFRAILGKRFGSNCVEIFASDDYWKYNGNSLVAVRARFEGIALSGDHDEVVVTGKMIPVSDSDEDSKFCGIATGYIFEISEVKEF